MALSKASMASKIQTRLKAETFPVQKEGSMSQSETDTYQLQYLEAFCQGIIDEFIANAKATGTDTPGEDTHNLDIV